MNRQWLGLVFVAVVIGAIGARYVLGPNPQRAARSDRAIAARGLAEAVAARFPGQRALVLSNPYTQRPGTARHILEMEEAGLEGVRAGAHGKFAIAAVVHPDLRPAALENPRAVAIDVETTTPLSYLVAPDAFDRVAQAHPDCTVLISLIGLPAELDQCEAWKKNGPPTFALLLPDLRLMGDPAAVVAAVTSGKITAIVLRKPGGRSEHEPVGRDFQAEFEQRFVLVTRNNVEDIAARTPSLLQSP